jgi:hypothetical protein
MKTLVYQCWTGPMRSGVEASRLNMQAYASRIGADYRFDKDPNIASKICDVRWYYEKLNPLVDDSFLGYDRVMSVDCDVFAVEGLERSIFDEPITDIGICTEPHQPQLRATLSSNICKANDEKWARAVKQKWHVDMPRNEAGLLKVYNTGMFVFTAAGLMKAREKFRPYQEYIDHIRAAQLPGFYLIDQNYLHAMMVAHLEYTELDNGWNSYVHYTGSADRIPRPVHDSRTADTKFVHIQLRGADDFDAQTLWRITNVPESEWLIAKRTG